MIGFLDRALAHARRCPRRPARSGADGDEAADAFLEQRGRIVDRRRCAAARPSAPSTSTVPSRGSRPRCRRSRSGRRRTEHRIAVRVGEERPAGSSWSEPPRVSRSPCWGAAPPGSRGRRATTSSGRPVSRNAPCSRSVPRPAPGAVFRARRLRGEPVGLERVGVGVGQVVRGDFLQAQVVRQRARGVENACERHGSSSAGSWLQRSESRGAAASAVPRAARGVFRR